MMKVGQLYRENIAAHIKEGLAKRSATFILGYSKISGPKMNDIRKNLRKAGAELYVSKNSVAKRVLGDLHFSTLADRFNGQMMFIFTDADSVEISKTLIKVAKDHAGILIQGGLLDGKILAKEDVKTLSDLPSKPTLIAMLLGTLQSPLVRLAGALNGKTQELLYVLTQLKEQKGGK